MGGYQRTRNHYVYVVAWDEAGIIKIGTSMAQRWRAFLIRGGRLVWLGQQYDLSRSNEDIYPGEWQYQRAALSFASKAFSEPGEAVPYLGNGGGGFLECYLLGDRTPEQFFAECAAYVLEHDAQALPPRIKPKPRWLSMPMHMPRTDARTY